MEDRILRRIKKYIPKEIIKNISFDFELPKEFSESEFCILGMKRYKKIKIKNTDDNLYFWEKVFIGINPKFHKFRKEYKSDNNVSYQQEIYNPQCDICRNMKDYFYISYNRIDNFYLKKIICDNCFDVKDILEYKKVSLEKLRLNYLENKYKISETLGVCKDYDCDPGIPTNIIGNFYEYLYFFHVMPREYNDMFPNNGYEDYFCDNIHHISYFININKNSKLFGKILEIKYTFSRELRIINFEDFRDIALSKYGDINSDMTGTSDSDSDADAEQAKKI